MQSGEESEARPVADDRAHRFVRTSRVVFAGSWPLCPPRMRIRRAAAIRPAGRPPPTSCPMLSGDPAYDCASVTKDRFPGESGHAKAPWTIRQDHPGGKAPALGTHHET